MAMALARTPDQSLADVYAEAGDLLEIAKTTGRDSIYICNRVLEWKQLADAAETKQVMTKMIKEFRCSPDLLNELASFYRESDTQWGVPNRTRNDRVDRPWRFHRRINMVLGASREGKDREFQRLRSELVSDFTGRKQRTSVCVRKDVSRWNGPGSRRASRPEKGFRMADNEQQANQTAEQTKPANEADEQAAGRTPAVQAVVPVAGNRREGQGGGPRGERGERGGDRGPDRGRDAALKARPRSISKS